MKSDEIIRRILELHTIAVVGLSPNETRPSYGVARYLIDQGYHIIPVNPGHDKILGLKSFPSLSSIPQPVDVVDVFRRPELVLPVAEEAIAILIPCSLSDLINSMAPGSGLIFPATSRR